MELFIACERYRYCLPVTASLSTSRHTLREGAEAAVMARHFIGFCVRARACVCQGEEWRRLYELAHQALCCMYVILGGMNYVCKAWLLQIQLWFLCKELQ